MPWKPFRRRCCEVPLLVGEDHVGAQVSGMLRVGDTHVEFVGVVIDPDADPEDQTLRGTNHEEKESPMTC